MVGYNIGNIAVSVGHRGAVVWYIACTGTGFLPIFAGHKRRAVPVDWLFYSYHTAIIFISK